MKINHVSRHQNRMSQAVQAHATVQLGGMTGNAAIFLCNSVMAVAQARRGFLGHDILLCWLMVDGSSTINLGCPHRSQGTRSRLQMRTMPPW